MKTEKRRAKFGEQILITDDKHSYGEYKAGDVMKVNGFRGDPDKGRVYTSEFPDVAAIHPVEYEVIIEEDKHAETNEA